MTLHQVRYFLRLADKLHFWQTAEHLNITQSSLSRHILTV
ncbi:LysR family transcriptional regulator [Hymenobacter sp.]